MFGSKAKAPPAPPMYVAPPAYNPAPAFQRPNYDLKESDLNKFVPRVQSAGEIVGSALGEGVANDLSNYGSGWLSLKESPTSSKNMEAAQNGYMAFARPEEAQLASDLMAGGQGGSSYAASVQGAQRAMNQMGSWTAGIQQRQADYDNVLAAHDALYRGPIGLAQRQNLADVDRGMGIANISQQDAGLENQYNLQDNMARNNYNLGSNQNQNQFSLGRYQGQLQGYGTQTQANTQRGIGNQGFLGGIANTIVGSRGLF